MTTKTSSIKTTGATTTTTASKLNTIQKQGQSNRQFDSMKTPTNILGQETPMEEGTVLISYAGGGHRGGRPMYKRFGNVFRNGLKEKLRRVKKTKKEKRMYKIMGYPTSDRMYGNYSGSWPAQAAHKALTALSRKIDLKNSNDLNQLKFWIIDEDSHKKYCYMGSRIKLVTPLKTVRSGKVVKYNYKTTLRKCEV